MTRGTILTAVLLATAAAACGDEGGHAPEITALSRADHRALFPIDTGAHAGADCNACHGDFDTFTKFTCLSCHEHDQARTDPIHASVSGYAWDSDACYTCHPTGEGASLDRGDHARYFPIDAGTSHAATGCSACHLQPAGTGGAEAFGCIDCHDHGQSAMQSAHDWPRDARAGVGRLYAYERTSCLQCHAHDVVVRRSTHSTRRFDGNNIAGSPGGPHSEETCSACHADRSFATYHCGPCHDPGSEAYEKTQRCDLAKGAACTDVEKYLYFFK